MDAISQAGLLRRRAVSARELITAHIERINQVDPAVNAIVTRCFDRALEQAAAADQAWPPGSRSDCCTGCRWRIRISSRPPVSARPSGR